MRRSSASGPRYVKLPRPVPTSCGAVRSWKGGHKTGNALTGKTQHLITVLGLLHPCGQAGDHGHLSAVVVPGNRFTQWCLHESSDQVQVFQVVGPYPPVPGLGLQPETDIEVWVRGRRVPVPMQDHTATTPFFNHTAVPTNEAPWCEENLVVQPGPMRCYTDVRDLLAARTTHEDRREKVVLRAARVPEPMTPGARAHRTSMRATGRNLLRVKDQVGRGTGIGRPGQRRLRRRRRKPSSRRRPCKGRRRRGYAFHLVSVRTGTVSRSWLPAAAGPETGIPDVENALSLVRGKPSEGHEYHEPSPSSRRSLPELSTAPALSPPGSPKTTIPTWTRPGTQPFVA